MHLYLSSTMHALLYSCAVAGRQSARAAVRQQSSWRARARRAHRAAARVELRQSRGRRRDVGRLPQRDGGAAGAVAKNVAKIIKSTLLGVIQLLH